MQLMQTDIIHFTSTKAQSVLIINVLCQVVLVGKQFVRINGAGADVPKRGVLVSCSGIC